MILDNVQILPILDYGDIVWGDKDNITIMNTLQMIQNKAAKLILDVPFFSSSTDALPTLGWMTLE